MAEEEVTENTEDVKDQKGLMVETNAAETEKEILTRPDNLPDKFWNDEKGFLQDGLIKSYNELEKQLRSTRAQTKAPEDYSLDFAGENVKNGDPLVGFAKEWAKENNIHQESFENLVNGFIQQGQDIMKQQEVSAENERKLLGENANAIIKSNIDWADGLERKGILSADDRMEMNEWGATAAGQRLMQKMRNLMGEQEIPVVSIDGQDFDPAELQTMISDPRYKTDESFRNKVTNLYQKHYN